MLKSSEDFKKEIKNVTFLLQISEKEIGFNIISEQVRSLAVDSDD